MAGGCVQPVAVERRGKWLDAEPGNERMVVNALAVVLDECAETTGVTEAQHGFGERQIDMVVLLRRRAGRNKTQAP